MYRINEVKTVNIRILKTPDWQKEVLAIARVLLPIAEKEVRYNKNKLYDEMRVWMPYVVRQQDNEGNVFSFENREYKPLGLKWGESNSNPLITRKTFDRKTAGAIIEILEGNYLYADGININPCNGFKGFKTYFKKLIALLDKFKTLDNFDADTYPEEGAARPPSQRPKPYKSPRERGVR